MTLFLHIGGISRKLVSDALCLSVDFFGFSIYTSCSILHIDHQYLYNYISLPPTNPSAWSIYKMSGVIQDGPFDGKCDARDAIVSMFTIKMTASLQHQLSNIVVARAIRHYSFSHELLAK